MAPPVVLIVDDDPVVLEMTRDALVEIGCDAHTHSSAVGTNAQLFKVKPQLLVLDINMPGLLKGNRICQIIRDQGFFQDLKILFYSSIPEAELKVMAHDHGADDYLTKSDDLNAFKRKIRQLLGLSPV